MKYFLSLGSKYEDAYYKKSATNINSMISEAILMEKYQRISLFHSMLQASGKQKLSNCRAGRHFPYADERQAKYAGLLA